MIQSLVNKAANQSLSIHPSVKITGSISGDGWSIDINICYLYYTKGMGKRQRLQYCSKTNKNNNQNLETTIVLEDQPANQSTKHWLINQSINQSNNQSTNQSINQLINQSINELTN